MATTTPRRSSTKAKPNFAGFGSKTFGFLRELADNNERDWFNAHKARYEADVLAPALDFIAAMDGPLQKLSDHFLALPQRQGGSLMRVYKDTRFSRDKTPFKTNIGIQFRHELAKDVHAPGYYVHIEPGRCFIGAGMWHPEAGALAKIRARINDTPAEWKKVVGNARFAGDWTLGGSSLARPPRGVSADHPYLTDLKRKDFIAACDLDDALVRSAELLPTVAAKFTSATPLMRFLCTTLDLSF